MANSQAKICADAIVRAAYGLSTNAAEQVANIVTNSACYSPINRDEASWLSAAFAYNPLVEQIGKTSTICSPGPTIFLKTALGKELTITHTEHRS